MLGTFAVPAPLYRSFCPTVIPGAKARRGCGEAGLSHPAVATMSLLSAAEVANARAGAREIGRSHCAGHCAGVRGMSPTKGGVRKHHPVGSKNKDRRSEGVFGRGKKSRNRPDSFRDAIRL